MDKQIIEKVRKYAPHLKQLCDYAEKTRNFTVLANNILRITPMLRLSGREVLEVSSLASPLKIRDM